MEINVSKSVRGWTRRIPMQMTRKERVVNHKPNTVAAEKGFSLIELMIASLVLIIGLASVATMISYSLTSNLITKNESLALSLAEKELERLKSLSINDTLLAAGGSTVGSNGKISFSGSAVANYNRAVTVTDAYQVGKSANFDVRWNVTDIATNIKKITIAAVRTGESARFKPVQLTYVKAR
jgi:Tfp pilus assembly protein PilV